MSDTKDKIAVIGMSGRFPGAQNIEKFWANLCEGYESIQKLSEESLGALFPNRNIPANYMPYVSQLENIDKFDAEFFRINPHDASIMDPQQRIVLEESWLAFENAGINPEKLTSKTGVYLSSSGSRYAIELHKKNEFDPHKIYLGNDRDLLATRVAYKLGLHGPCFSVQCACSSSLASVSLACDQLLSHNCDTALAGGVTISRLRPSGYRYYSDSIYSSDGRCCPYSNRASGTIFSDAAGMIVLKRLDDALADKDFIHAVIDGWALNNDGNDKAGFTAPSAAWQAKCISEAYEFSQIPVDQVRFVEGHGTGTQLGDPIEVSALTDAFQEYTQERQFCALGSVKSNIGHADNAAGVVGFIKAVMVVKTGLIPPTLHFEEENESIKFSETPFFVNNKTINYPETKNRYVGVSSFGIGGTNVHIVLENNVYQESENIDTGESTLPVLVSAKSRRSAQELVAAYSQALRNRSLEFGLASYLSFTKQPDFKYRAYLTRQALEAQEKEDINDKIHSSMTNRTVVFAFSGQGTHHWTWGKQYYKDNAFFKSYADECFSLFEKYYPEDLLKLVFSNPEKLVNNTYLQQPIIFTMEYAAAQSLLGFGIKPSALLGHSLGEYVAAVIAGAIDLIDAVNLVACRSRLLEASPDGKMVYIYGENIHTIDKLSRDHGLQMALYNSKKNRVVGGEHKKIDAFVDELVKSDRGLIVKELATKKAFHTELVRLAGEMLIAELSEKINSRERVSIPWLSNVSGDWHTDSVAGDYWGKHIYSPVRFSECIDAIFSRFGENITLVEIGPEAGLGRLFRDNTVNDISCVSLTRDTITVEESLAKLWQLGCTIEWNKLCLEKRCKEPVLSAYPFDRKSYWLMDLECTAEPDKTESNHVSLDTSNPTSTTINSFEESVYGACRKELGLDKVSKTNNFIEIGGDSLAATRVISFLNEKHNLELKISMLLESESLGIFFDKTKAMPEKVEKRSLPDKVKRVFNKDGFLQFPVSSQQQRIWYSEQLGMRQNVKIKFSIKSVINLKKFNRAIEQLVGGHEIFRTTFELNKDGLNQIVSSRLGDHKALCFSRERDGDQEIDKNIKSLNHIKFDLSKKPLFHILLVHELDMSTTVYMVFHHILIDGQVVSLLIHKIMDCYNRSDTNNTRANDFQYIDYSKWQKSFFSSREYLIQEKFWRTKLQGRRLGSGLQGSNCQLKSNDLMAASFDLRLGKNESRSIRELAAHLATTPFSIWLTALALSAYTLSNQCEQTIGVVVSGRTQKAWDNVMGCFVKNLPITLNIDKYQTFSKMTHEFSAEAFKCLDAQDFQLEKLLPELNIKSEYYKTPLFQIFFAFHSDSDGRKELENKKIYALDVDVGQDVAKFDIAFHVNDIGESVSINVIYRESIFDRKLIIDLSNTCVDILNKASQNSEIIIDDFCQLRSDNKKNLVMEVDL